MNFGGPIHHHSKSAVGELALGAGAAAMAESAELMMQRTFTWAVLHECKAVDG
jgi:hypothetical protein